MKAIDLFAGCGGLSLGFARAGWQITRAVEIDPMIAKTYARNHPGARLLVEDIGQAARGGAFTPGEAQIIIGGPPCQGFSMAGARIRGGFVSDPRNQLFRHYLHIVRRVRPRAFLMENVKGMLTMEKGAIFREIVSLFSDPGLFDGLGYQVFSTVGRAQEYGIPQKRERVLLIGVRQERGVDFAALWARARRRVQARYPDFFQPVTVYQAISDLSRIPEGEGVPAPPPESAYQRALRDGQRLIYNHTATRHNRKATDRMRQIAARQNYTALEEDIRSVHSGSYGRLSWDEMAPTITTRFDTPSGGRFIHPVKDRTLTPREAARIQSFPDSFVFEGGRSSVCRQIGNAVPPKLAYFLAVMMEEMLYGNG